MIISGHYSYFPSEMSVFDLEMPLYEKKALSGTKDSSDWPT